MEQNSFTGFVGDLSLEQEKTLAQVREWIRESAILDLERIGYDDHDLLRFCRARKFILPDVKAMVEQCAAWRKQEQIDDIIETYKMPKEEEDAMLKAHSFFYHGIDKLGRPVFIDRVGVMDLEAKLEATTLERAYRYAYQDYEKQLRIRFPACSEQAGRKIQQGMTIFDMTDGSVSTMNRQLYAILRHTSTVCSDYYPETMGNTLMINTPFLFYGCWSVIKNFLDERTRQKIRIVGGNYMSTVEEFIDKKDLPTFLGGQCTCSEYEGGCERSNIGPWNDYVFANNQLLRKG